ncbi:MAG: efflux RND transporter periplasmic adaptor subunit [Rhodobacteraceae bacterium]|nr:efflux RND transporter periplasmic adaptor subunit [Paracoccaceae bacterium]
MHAPDIAAIPAERGKTGVLLRLLSRGTLVWLCTVAILVLHDSLAAHGEVAGTQGEAAMSPRPVSVETVRRAVVEERTHVFARVAARDPVAVTMPVSDGLVSHLPAAIGDWVEAGEIIARLDPRMAERALREAELRVATAQSTAISASDRLQLSEAALSRNRDTLARVSQLAENGAAAETRRETAALEVDRAETDYSLAASALQLAQDELALAELAVDQARIALEDTTLTAPVAGRILALPLERGTRPAPGTRAATIAAQGRLALEMDLPVTHLSRLVVGQDMPLTLSDGTTLRPRLISLPFGTEGGTGLATLRLDLPEDSALLPGMTLAADLVLQRRLAIEVPLAALTLRGDTAAVMRVVDGRAVATPVTLAAPRADGKVEVLSGLSEGDVIVARAPDIVQDGEAVVLPGDPGRRRTAALSLLPDALP